MGNAIAKPGESSSAAKCVLSVDVEDWFHILDVPSTPPMCTWDSLPSRVEASFRELLELFGRYNVRCTCFFLGWVAEKYPQLVREAHSLGHEVASHGYSHRLIYEMSSREFSQDTVRTKHVLEALTGQPVVGYRAPGFSVTEKTPWFFDALGEAGYQYDSSVFPATRTHGGMKTSVSPYVIQLTGATLVEFPISVIEALSSRVCVFGGGYLRLAPWPIVRLAAKRVLKEQRPLIFYIHPREIDPEHPRLPMNFHRRFKSYVNLKSTGSKLENIMRKFPLTTFRQLLTEHHGRLGREVKEDYELAEVR